MHDKAFEYCKNTYAIYHENEARTRQMHLFRNDKNKIQMPSFLFNF